MQATLQKIHSTHLQRHTDCIKSMDPQVLRSIVKWPEVPHCFGWLALDRRGQWRMRDEYSQQNQLPGNVIRHEALNECIGRNYACDASGRYFFQNGPQRVFITLDATPWILRLMPDSSDLKLLTQCQSIFTAQGALSDESGNIYISGLVEQTFYEEDQDLPFSKKECLSLALLHDHDLGIFSELAQVQESACSFKGSWKWHGKELPIDPIHSDELAKQFHFVLRPTD